MTKLMIDRNAIDSIMRRAIDALCCDIEYSTDAIIDLIDSFADESSEFDIDDASFAIIDIIDSCIALLQIDIDALRPMIDASLTARE
jgi:hypothetical protein